MVSEECPAESTNRSRPAHRESRGSCRRNRWNSRYAAGARLIAVPGWPLPTFCTASAASTRNVSTARRSRSVHSRSVLAALFTDPHSCPERQPGVVWRVLGTAARNGVGQGCLLYTSDAADEED